MSEEDRNPSPPPEGAANRSLSVEGPPDDEDEDVIPGTSFSNAYFLKALVRLADLKAQGREELDEDSEGMLETLWDMSQAKVVCERLLENGFLGIALAVVYSNPSPRLHELVAGITGNIACQKELLEDASTDPSLCELLPFLLGSRDVETLCEALRAVNALLSAQAFHSDNFQSRLSETWEERGGLGKLLGLLAASSNPRLLDLASEALDLLLDDRPEKTLAAIKLNEQESLASMLEALSEGLTQELPSTVANLLHAFSNLYRHQLRPAAEEERKLAEFVVRGLQLASKTTRGRRRAREDSARATPGGAWGSTPSGQTPSKDTPSKSTPSKEPASSDAQKKERSWEQGEGMGGLEAAGTASAFQLLYAIAQGALEAATEQRDTSKWSRGESLDWSKGPVAAFFRAKETILSAAQLLQASKAEGIADYQRAAHRSLGAFLNCHSDLPQWRDFAADLKDRL